MISGVFSVCSLCGRPLTGGGRTEPDPAVLREMGQMKQQLTELAKTAAQAQAQSRAMEAKLDRALATIDKLAAARTQLLP